MAEIVTIFGSQIGPPEPVGYSLTSADGKVTSTLADTRVLFDAVPAPFLFQQAHSPKRDEVLSPEEHRAVSQACSRFQFVSRLRFVMTGSTVPFVLTIGPHWTFGQVTVAVR
jgi:hypothetical protein